MPYQGRIEWSELRETGVGREWFFLIAEESEEGLKLHERSTNEVRWHEIPWTSELVAKYATEQARAKPEGYPHAEDGRSSFLPISNVMADRGASGSHAAGRLYTGGSSAMPEARAPPISV